MPQLEKATLEPVWAYKSESKKDKSYNYKPADPKGKPMEVQFNPTSLHLKMSNQNEGGRTLGRQRRQQIGTSSTVLTLELIFDTADETTGSPDNPQPVSVR
ncbi:MAG: hypothetical protein D3924_20215, partial [Candidatus Electrothrix sp. AR4]|nr:hypothetical protein [Candidatus Electrothrix sp. AR4]